MAREITMLTDEEVLALDEVLIRDNESLNYVSYDGGWGGLGNTNTTEFTEMYSRAKPLGDLRGQKILKPGYNARSYTPIVAAAVEDILYVIAEGEVHRLHLFESCTIRRGIAYDTYESSSVWALSDRVVTLETELGTYTGTAVKGVPEGKGVYIYREDDPYDRIKSEGFFIDGQLVETARITYKDGSEYYGTIKNGLPNASVGGKLTYPNGEFYVGGFKDGKPHGNGVLHNPDKTWKHNGRWENGEIVK